MSVPLIEVCGVTKHFVKRLDVAGKIARRLGADVNEEVVSQTMRSSGVFSK